jgi:hypothetical protein
MKIVKQTIPFDWNIDMKKVVEDALVVVYNAIQETGKKEVILDMEFVPVAGSRVHSGQHRAIDPFVKELVSQLRGNLDILGCLTDVKVGISVDLEKKVLFPSYGVNSDLYLWFKNYQPDLDPTTMIMERVECSLQDGSTFKIRHEVRVDVHQIDKAVRE